MPEMIKIPVITKCGPPVKLTENGAYVKNNKGVISWSYQGKAVTGKGIYVAACARSGTVYMTEVLKALGYKIGHEATDEDGSVGYHLAIIKPKNCFHQVRHPLKQISSMFDHQSWGFMNHVVEVHGRGLLGCMQYWLKWNEILEEFCVWRYQLEKIREVWPEFLERINHAYEPLPEVERTNKREKSLVCWDKDFSDFTWADLFNCNRQLAQDIIEMGERYGYQVPQGQNEVSKSQTTLVA